MPMHRDLCDSLERRASALIRDSKDLDSRSAYAGHNRPPICANVVYIWTAAHRWPSMGTAATVMGEMYMCHEQIYTARSCVLTLLLRRACTDCVLAVIGLARVLQVRDRAQPHQARSRQ